MKNKFLPIIKDYKTKKETLVHLAIVSSFWKNFFETKIQLTDYVKSYLTENIVKHPLSFDNDLYVQNWQMIGLIYVSELYNKKYITDKQLDLWIQQTTKRINKYNQRCKL